MSGHSKWSTIKHKKSITDQKRGKLFSSISKAITVATKEGQSGDPNQNPSLRLVIDKARAANMPSDNIKRAIQRGLNPSEGDSSFEEVTYEGYGPGGVGIMAITKTDNRKRTGAEIRFIFEKNSGSLAGPGSTSYLFEKSGNDIKTKVPMPITDQSVKTTIQKLVISLKQHSDVKSVFSNASYS